MKEKRIGNTIAWFTIGGFIIGVGVVLVATVTDFIIRGLPFAWKSYLQLHDIDPVIYFIDISPFFLALISLLIGVRFSKISKESRQRVEQEFNERFKRILSFTQCMASGDIDTTYISNDKDDKLGITLVELQENLRRNKQEEENRRREDAQRAWAAEGLAKFGEILRGSGSNLDELAYNTISNLVLYVNACQGGFFVHNEEDNTFVLSGCYAFDRKKHLEKTILWGEGLVGRCALEKESIYLDDIPQGYMKITSGLGDADPTSILITPLKVNDEIHGVIEIASFYNLAPHEISFIEKLAESIAATISSTKINMQTKRLLQESQFKEIEEKNQIKPM